MTTAFGKADAKGACPGDPAAVNAQVSGCATTVKDELPPKAPGCGNGIVEGFAPFNETCDDGNTADGDSCPASCHIDSCTAVPASSFGAHVTYTGPGGTTISGLGYFVDYPEGKITSPGTTAPFGVSQRRQPARLRLHRRGRQARRPALAAADLDLPDVPGRARGHGGRLHLQGH